MTAITATHTRLPNAAIAILLAAAIAAAAVSQHALLKHGAKAIAAAHCVERPELMMVNPETGRTAYICLTEYGWGIAIIAPDGGPVTSFVKDKMRTMTQVVKYLRNVGYKIK